MNEIEQLRQAMRATEDTHPGRLDLDTVLREGRRLRRRRRLAGTGVVMLSTAAVLGVAAGVLGVRPTEPAPPPAPAASASTPAPSPTPSSEEPRPIGDVVGTGIWYGDAERVFYFVPVDLPDQPRISIGLVAGRRTDDGLLVADYLVNDVEGSDRRPGFHEMGYDDRDPSELPVPAFGYFVGPAKRIVGTVDGGQVTAHLAYWSRDQQVVIFWFDPRQLAPGTRLDGIAAFDAKGRKL